jgi:Holliday junction resolvasome RuvABC DNA-binding subunit
VFGDAFVESRLAAREDRVTRNDEVARSHVPVRQSPTGSDAFAKVRSALIHMGFCQRTVASALLRLHREQPALELEPLLRAALKLLTPPRWPGPLASTFAVSRA